MSLDLQTEERMLEVEEKEELTLQNVPKAVNYLINEIAEMRVTLENMESRMKHSDDKHRPVDIEKAVEILGEKKTVIYKMIRNREIPYYDKGRKLYFFEDELISWVEKDRVETSAEAYKRMLDSSC